jgi:hypothetical protein
LLRLPCAVVRHATLFQTVTMKNLLLTLGLSLLAASGAAAQSLSGAWDGSMNTPGGARPVNLVLVQDGEKLTGTVKRPTGDVPLEGTVKGSEVRFRYMINYGGNPIAMEVTATLAGASEMKGSVDIAGQVKEEFSATRAAAAAPPKN